MSIAENLCPRRPARPGRGAWVGRLSPKLMDEMRDRVSQLRMGLEDRLGNAIGSLSGGQRQALTLLMATWLKPSLLLLDEHTAALDPKSADLVIRVTEEIINRHQLTTLMVTHSMQQAVNLGDRIVMMHQGSVAYRFEGAEKKRLRVNDLLARLMNCGAAKCLMRRLLPCWKLPTVSPPLGSQEKLRSAPWRDASTRCPATNPWRS